MYLSDAFLLCTVSGVTRHMPPEAEFWVGKTSLLLSYRVESEAGLISSYVHTSPAPGLGRMAALVALETSTPSLTEDQQCEAKACLFVLRLAYEWSQSTECLVAFERCDNSVHASSMLCHFYSAQCVYELMLTVKHDVSHLQGACMVAGQNQGLLYEFLSQASKSHLKVITHDQRTVKGPPSPKQDSQV